MAKTKEQVRAEYIQTQFKLAKENAEFIWSLLDKEIPDPVSIINFQGNPLLYESTLIMIQGKEGTHKSRLASALASLLVSDSNFELLGFNRTGTEPIPIMYIDTERNKFHQLPNMLKQIMYECQLDKDELRKRFTVVPFSEIKRGDRLDVMGEQYKELNTDPLGTAGAKKSMVIILDIVSDFIADFNNLQMTYHLTDILNASTNGFNITFIVVLHENPGISDKARGHLGTELANKASTVLQIAATDIPDVYRIGVKKSRMTAKYKPILLKFDKDANNLVVLTDSELADKIADPDCFKLCEALSARTFTQAKIERKDLFEYLIQELGWSERKIHAKVTFIINSKKEFDSEYGRVYLKKTRGTTTQFELELLELPNRAENQLSNEDSNNEPPVPA